MKGLSQTELYDKAAEWDRRLQQAQDPTVKATMKQLRDYWIELGNQSVAMTPDALAQAVAKIEEVEANLGSDYAG